MLRRSRSVLLGLLLLLAACQKSGLNDPQDPNERPLPWPAPSAQACPFGLDLHSPALMAASAYQLRAVCKLSEEQLLSRVID
jgi:hypothetical protein